MVQLNSVACMMVGVPAWVASAALGGQDTQIRPRPLTVVIVHSPGSRESYEGDSVAAA